MKEFIEVIKQLIELFRELTPLEEEKLKAARANQITFVEDCMVKEQSAILKLRGLENEREKRMKEIGMSGLSFREIIEKSPEHADELRPLFAEFNSTIQVFREVNEGANVILKTNLNQIENALKLKDGGMYSESGQATTPDRHFTDRKV